MNRIVVGMSGGVDSSITLALLKEKGWKPVGVSLKLPVWKDDYNPFRENACCTDESLQIAKEICDKLGVEYHVYDVRKDFEKEVIVYFLDELKNNRTPNPCVICNRYLKFKKLFEWAEKHDIHYVATGHYARIHHSSKSNKYELLKAKDQTKDQTYGLCMFNQNWLKHIVLPLGDYTKEEVYALAKKKGFDVFLKRKQSQDLCFVSGDALHKFIEEHLGKTDGDIIDVNGKVVGKHKGLYYYTVGQKRGMNLPGTFYIKEFDVKNNQIIVSKKKEDVIRKEVVLKNFNFISGEDLDKPIEVEAKIRYGPVLNKARLYLKIDGETRIVFKEALFAVTPGQFCVVYKGDLCIGGGVIS